MQNANICRHYVSKQVLEFVEELCPEGFARTGEDYHELSYIFYQQVAKSDVILTIFLSTTVSPFPPTASKL